METLREFLSNKHHFTSDAELKRRAVSDRLGELIPSEASPLWFLALATFVQDRPRRYWDDTTVRGALSLLEQDVERTAAAIKHLSIRLNNGFDWFFLESQAANSEETFGMFRAQEVAKLNSVFHPEYLRIVEHVFGNLVSVYWAVQRKGGVNAAFELKKSVGELKRNGFNELVCGYDDRVRNAVAHGEIVYRGIEIRYGPPAASYALSPQRFLGRFDDLVRTSNALALSIILFWARHHDTLQRQGATLPVRLLGYVAAAAMDGSFVSFEGAYESETADEVRQFNIGLRTRLAKREWVLMTTGTIAYQMLQLASCGYERFAFEIDYERGVSSVVVVDVSALQRLLEDNASVDRFSEMWFETPLLWLDEGTQRTRYRVWRSIAHSGWEKVWDDVRRDRAKQGIRTGHSGYWMRSFRDTSVGAYLRAEMTIVLRNPEDAHHRDRIRTILWSAMKAARRRQVKRRIGSSFSEHGWWAHPKDVTIRVYRRDGPLRWLGGGWANENLVAIAAWRAPFTRQPKGMPLVNHVQDRWKGMRIQYEMAPWVKELFAGSET